MTGRSRYGATRLALSLMLAAGALAGAAVLPTSTARAAPAISRPGLLHSGLSTVAAQGMAAVTSTTCVKRQQRASDVPEDRQRQRGICLDPDLRDHSDPLPRHRGLPSRSTRPSWDLTPWLWEPSTRTSSSTSTRAWALTVRSCYTGTRFAS